MLSDFLLPFQILHNRDQLVDGFCRRLPYARIARPNPVIGKNGPSTLDGPFFGLESGDSGINNPSVRKSCLELPQTRLSDSGSLDVKPLQTVQLF